MICYHCAAKLERDEQGRTAHLCPDGHRGDRFGGMIGQKPMYIMKFACGCSISAEGDWAHFASTIGKPGLMSICVEHNSPAIEVENYIPKYPCDPNDDYWKLTPEEELDTILELNRILEDTE